MTDTTAVGGINQALADLQTQLPHIAKNNTAKAGSYQYQYADLAEISRQTLPLLGKLGLSFTSRPTVVDGKFALAYELRHVSGQVIEGVYPLPERGTPQEIGGAITYARRYCLCAVTGVAPDNDDEDAVLAETAARKMRVERVEEKIAATQQPAEPRITAEQQRDMQTLFQDAQITEKTKKLDYAVAVVKRKISSATELTQVEADKVISSLTAAAEKSAKAGDAQPTGGVE